MLTEIRGLTFFKEAPPFREEMEKVLKMIVPTVAWVLFFSAGLVSAFALTGF